LKKQTTPMTKSKVGECSRMDEKYMIETNGVSGTLLEFLIFLTTDFDNKKRPILDRRKKNLLIILDKSF
jgi:hypothetical protein